MSARILTNTTVTLRAATGTFFLFAGVVCWRYELLPTMLEAGLLAVNLLAVFLYGIDKLAAMAGTRRVPEVVLITLGCLGGWPAAYLAQMLFHHKISKLSFQIACIAAILVNALLLYMYLAYVHTQLL